MQQAVIEYYTIRESNQEYLQPLNENYVLVSCVLFSSKHMENHIHINTGDCNAVK